MRILNGRHFFLSTAIVLTVVGASCGKKNKGGSPMGMGQLLLPVKESAPTGLKAGSAAVTGLVAPLQFLAAPSELSTVKDRLFSPGPTDFMYRLKMVDGRLAELDARHQDSARKCVTEAPQEWKLTGLPDANGTLTGTTSFWFSCMEKIDVTNVSPTATLTIYFGRKDGQSYLAELSTNPAGGNSTPTIAVLGKVDDSSTKSEIWQIMVTPESTTDTAKQHSSWMYILGDKTNLNFEMAVGGSGKSSTPTDTDNPVSYLGCGVRMKSSASLVYAKGRFHDAGSTVFGAGGDTCTDTEAVVCASATDLSAKDEADCSTLTTFATPVLTYSQLKGTASPAAGYTLGLDIIKAKGMPTLTSFNDTVEPK
jgi:hypothetical protein